MKLVGIDAGSTYIKLAILDMELDRWTLKRVPTLPGYDSEVLKHIPENSRIVVTGYCRKVLAEKLKAKAINEIKAQSVGVALYTKDSATVLDVGGQDTKVIRLTNSNGFSDFLMNDRCAAGTGRFLEVAASRLGISVEEMDSMALKAKGSISISSMCVVFAESEIVSLLAQGIPTEEIALAVFKSVADRISAMVKGFGITGRVIFTGGAANSKCLRVLLEERLGTKVEVPIYPQFSCSMGAALIAGNVKPRELSFPGQIVSVKL
ncbi:CoA-substrate-specific enzyme activase [Thermosulfidibacter takaii ABI70S6]|uniref:CoA-substrate-specific enzyme activase n=1 Tax=Thermosulfidibacter takaii (strain DSM 17441 / JCM 13301 / NBRC 103674 / ABI70S6) TaxID=1298851 RepID=A0A0S3QTK6_THET7|nr:acyl-CoA dehydratase activase [Thermosulfidibacter takaii]BAT71666.1 CoA-substrate-specific enzyme activase [Thermosulfidibacter takaii ABI70S6]